MVIGLSFNLTGQIRQSIFVVPTKATAFGTSLPANTLVFCTADSLMYQLTASATSVTTLNTATTNRRYPLIDVLGNTMVGYVAGKSITTGNNNVLLGHSAGYSLTNKGANVLIGYRAGYTSNAQNTMVGYNAGNLTTGGGNVMMGSSVCAVGATGNYNVFIGDACATNNTANNNIMIGYQCGITNTSGTPNVFIGTESGKLNSTGGSNVFIGHQSGMNNIVTGNTFIGQKSGITNTTGLYNVYLGFESGYLNQTGAGNTNIGYSAGYNNIVGANTFLGYQSGLNNTTGTPNIYIGYQAGLNHATNGDNIFLGYQSGLVDVSGARNLYIGTLSNVANVNGNDNVGVGYGASQGVTAGNNNTSIGNQAGNTGNYSDAVAIGRLCVIGHNTSGSMAMGYGANSTINYGIAIGYAAFADGSNTAGYAPTSVGANAYAMRWGASFGYAAGLNDRTTATGNTYIGSNAGAGTVARATNYNTSIGYSSLYSLINGAVNNTAIGSEAGYYNAAANNLFMGYRAGYNNTTGTPNTYIGYESGFLNQTGGGNIFIGYQAGYNETGSNKLYIENSNATNPLIKGDFTNDSVSIYGTLGVNSAGGIRMISSLSDATNKTMRITCRHYTNAEDDMMIINATSNGAVTGGVTYGGGNTSFNAVPFHKFYTTAALGTVTGTLRMTIDDGGLVGIGPQTTLTLSLGLGGTVARTFGMERHTTGNTAGNTLSINAGGATSAATDKNGGNLILKSGTATGTGFSDIQLQTVTPGSTGTTDRTPTDKFVIMSRVLADNGNFTLTSGRSGIGMITFGDGEEYAWFSFTTAAVVTLITNSANVTTTGATNDKLNIYDGGTSVTIENTFTATKTMTITLTYNL